MRRVFFKRLYLFIFGGERGKEERNINVWLALARPLLGTRPPTQAYALTRIQPGTPPETPPGTPWFTGQDSIH